MSDAERDADLEHGADTDGALSRGGGGARADAVTAAVLVVFGALVVVESWRMPRMTEFGSSAWSAPGVVPGMIGALLALMGLILHARSRAALARASGVSPREAGAVRRVLVAFALCAGFAALLVGLIPFVLATFLFVLAFVLVFDREDRHVAGTRADRATLARRAALAVVVAAVAAFAITGVFEDVFFVRLP